MFLHSLYTEEDSGILAHATWSCEFEACSRSKRWIVVREAL